MPTTFNVFFLGSTGNFRLDPFEGNNTVENAAGLQGASSGSTANPLSSRIVEFSPGSTGFGGGNSTIYDTNNNAAGGGGDTFRINGGPDQIFDASAVYDSVITYEDGTTAQISAVIIQDTNGNVYLAPEFSANADQAALEAQPIRSINIGRLTDGQTQYAGLTANREAGNFAICFTRRTRLLTPGGYVAIEDIRPGDMICTVDNGPQRVEWAGSTMLSAEGMKAQGNLRPVRLRQGHYGLTRDVLVSPQHCVTVGDSFVRARHLAEISGAGARIARGVKRVKYYHLLCEQHQVLIAEGMHTESFYPGPNAIGALGPEAVAGLERAVPGLVQNGLRHGADPIGPTARPILKRHELRDVFDREALLAVA
ncbi:Hint domain-containing protein [Roseovarius nanhaiticus]|uniref:Hint domain-containing protein n=1 Tax=Roseovarius nanhaiticus TaxID=573024 RepID=A0A1N7G265_9RHOB|nr:Hint domain-containing protein [Roseovarius nanhaiticus]SEK39244.1 Hint domain-containing protein [Roseovarius nanhaiticus]SIS06641.1 Hint domain-containing protein [Roseovarius nanhaiticus]